MDRGYLGRILMLTLLAPDIVEAIMDGRQPAELGVHVLREGFPVEWGEQRVALRANDDETATPWKFTLDGAVGSLSHAHAGDTERHGGG